MTAAVEPQARTPEPPEITTADIMIRRTADGDTERVQVLAEATDTPGLFLAPNASTGRLSGDWDVLHGPSGLVVPIDWRSGTDINTARRVATELGKLDIDWTQGKDDIVAVFHADPKAIRDAVERGRYPKPDPDADDDKVGSGPAPYPRTEAQATADAIARVIVDYTRRRAAATWDVMNRRTPDDPDGTAIDALNGAAVIHGHGLAAVLRAFHDADPVAADAAARDIWDAWQDGGSVHEWLGVWAQQYGLEPLAEKDKTADDAAEHVVALGRGRLDDPLPYTGDTFQQLREMMARYAALGQRRFAEFGTRTAAGGPRQLTDRECEDEKIAHGCTFFGWALLSVLSRMAKDTPAVAVSYAEMVDDIGANGGAPYAEDLVDENTGELTLTDRPDDKPAPGQPAG